MVQIIAFTVVIHGRLDTRVETRCPEGVSISFLASRSRHFRIVYFSYSEIVLLSRTYQGPRIGEYKIQTSYIRPYYLSGAEIMYNITIHLYVPYFYDLSTLVGCWSSVYIRRIIYKFLNVCHFDYTAFAVSGKVGYP